MTDELYERFADVGLVGEPDWSDVIHRAGRRSRRRRVTLAACIVAAAALVVPTAVALRGSVVDFFAGEPAPKPVVLDFARLDVGAPAGMETGVIAEQTRAVLHKHLANGRVLTVWVAPTNRSGFCALYGHSGGCHPPYSIPVEHGVSIQGPIANGVIRGGPVLVSGSVQLPDAATIELALRARRLGSRTADMGLRADRSRVFRLRRGSGSLERQQTARACPARCRRRCSSPRARAFRAAANNA